MGKGKIKLESSEWYNWFFLIGLIILIAGVYQTFSEEYDLARFLYIAGAFLVFTGLIIYLISIKKGNKVNMKKRIFNRTVDFGIIILILLRFLWKLFVNNDIGLFIPITYFGIGLMILLIYGLINIAKERARNYEEKTVSFFCTKCHKEIELTKKEEKEFNKNGKVKGKCPNCKTSIIFEE